MESILIVDDSSTIRKTVIRELENGNYKVDGAGSCEEALVLFNKKEYDLVILDVEMPDRDGFDTLIEIKKCENFNRRKKVQIVFFTATDRVELRERGFDLGATDFVIKDFGAGMLLLSINRILHEQNRFKGTTVLCIDDMKTYRKIISNSFSRVGVDVLEAKDGAEGLKLFIENRDIIDLIVTDNEMPNMNGVELVKEIRTKLGDQKIPIIVASSDPSKEKIVELFNAGVNDYLIKPYLQEELVTRSYTHLEAYFLQKIREDNVQELVVLNKLKDQFLSVCSHDLRTPINGVIGLSELLLEEDLTESQKEMLVMINSSGKYLSELINDLLDLQKIKFNKNVEVEEVLSFSIFEDCLNTMKPVADLKNIKLILDHNVSENYKFFVEPLKIKRALNNLISNAIKFSNLDSIIQIKIEDESNKTIISVKDNGIGIKHGDLTKIFEEFSTTSKSGTEGELGTGLGLSIVKNIADMHGGSVEVESEVGKGSIFRIFLPY